MTQNHQGMLVELRGLSTIVRVDQAVLAQVLVPTPVILLDALGRRASFHTELTDSAETRARSHIHHSSPILIGDLLQAFVALLNPALKKIPVCAAWNKASLHVENKTRRRGLDLSRRLE